MKHLDEFTISLSGSKEGINEYTFNLKKDFFVQFDDQEILDANVDVQMTLTKSINVYEMNFELWGNLTVICDRCLEPMNQEIDYETELIVKYGNEYEEIDDIVVTIPQNEDEINIASFIFEYAKLALPIQHTHEEGECNGEMLEQIRKYQRTEEDKNNTDSRWDTLAQLRDKLN